MARDASPAQALYDALVSRSVTSVLRPLGFRRSAQTFHRRHGEAVQVVNLQGSQGSGWDEKLFYVNVGLAFDAVCRLTGAAILEKPREHECEERGMRARLEQLAAGVPERWSVRSGSDAVAEQLHAAMVELAAELQRIDGAPAYREHRWFGLFRPAGTRAQILYLTGELDAARAEIEELCRLFADREPLNRAEWWREELGLPALAG